MLWSPLFFRLHRPDWALIEVAFLWLSVLVPMIVFSRYAKLASWLLALSRLGQLCRLSQLGDRQAERSVRQLG